MWDVFISHAWEDKDDVARPLANALSKAGYRVWFDEFTLTLGDSLRRSIDTGLSESKFGIVILSPSFFAKEWPQRELDGLTAREIKAGKIILPIWHNVTRDDVERFSPVLADRLGVSTEEGFDVVLEKVIHVLNRYPDSTATSKIPSKTSRYIDRIKKRGRVIGLIAGLVVITGVAMRIIGISANSNPPSSTPSTSIASITPLSTSPISFSNITSTPDAQQISIAKFVGGLYEDTLVGYSNLDGIGPEEIVIYALDRASNHYYISVYAFFEDEDDWLQVLYLRDEMACGFKFDFLNLKNDDTRQLLVYRECGSGSFVYLEIYEYKGFKYTNMLYTLPDPVSGGVVEVVNQEAYIVSYIEDALYYLVWDGTRVNARKITYQLPANTMEIHFWRDGNRVVFSESSIELEKGQLVYFIHNVNQDTEYCGSDLRADSDFLDFTEYPNVLIARGSGYTSVTIDCKFQPAVGSIEVKIR